VTGVNYCASANLPQAQPQPAPPGQATQIEHLLHSLQITELALLLRAAALDQATHELLAEANAKSRQQDSATAPQPWRNSNAPNRPPSLASKDLPRRVTTRAQSVTQRDDRLAIVPPKVTASANCSATKLRRPGISR